MVMQAVAAALGIPGATAVLHGRHREAVLVAASDATARAAHDLETALGEGAATAAMTGARLVHAAGRELPARWPRYGPAIGQIGIHAVTAAPLRCRPARSAHCAATTAGPPPARTWLRRQATSPRRSLPSCSAPPRRRPCQP